MKTQTEKEEKVKEAVKEFETVGGAKVEYLIKHLENQGISEDFTRETVEKGLRKGTYYVENGLIKTTDYLQKTGKEVRNREREDSGT